MFKSANVYKPGNIYLATIPYLEMFHSVNHVIVQFFTWHTWEYAILD